MKKFEVYCTLGELLNFLDLWGCDQKILVSHTGRNCVLKVYNTDYERRIVEPVFFEVICAGELSKMIARYDVLVTGELLEKGPKVVDDLKDYFIMRITDDSQSSFIRLSTIKSLPEEMLIELDKDHNSIVQKNEQIRKVALWLLPSDSIVRERLINIKESD